jgi:hypothetical protein
VTSNNREIEETLAADMSIVRVREGSTVASVLINYGIVSSTTKKTQQEHRKKEASNIICPCHDKRRHIRFQ